MRFSISVFVIVYFYANLISANLTEKDSLELRCFPELQKYKINAIDLVDSNFAVAADPNNLLYWNGNDWKLFEPQPQFKNYTGFHIKAFSPKNIWIFYLKEECYYHTDCLHFDGIKWKSIWMPQATVLQCFSFIDSTRFFASGDWGDLIYFDGEKAINIKSKAKYVSLVSAFSPDHFYLFALNNDYKTGGTIFYEIKNNRWSVIDTLKNQVNYINFENPYSGIVIENNDRISIYSNKKKVESIHFNQEIINAFVCSNNKVYFWSKNYVWQYFSGKFKRIFSIPFIVSTCSINKSDLHFLGNNHKVYYFGRRKVGELVQEISPRFERNTIEGDLVSGHFAVSEYRNVQNSKELYFIKTDETNNFYHFPNPGNLCVFEDVRQKRNLVDFGKTHVGGNIWDGGFFFADIDNDEDMDGILSALRGETQFFENVGNDYFLNVTEFCGLNIDGRISKICYGDLNNDGLLDFIYGDEFGPLRFYINNGFWQFELSTDISGISDSLKGYIPTLTDIDNDQDLDLFLTAMKEPIRYYENQGTIFENESPSFIDKSSNSPDLTTRFDFFTESISFGDYDNDGDEDLFISNRTSPLKFFRNNGNGKFSDVSEKMGFNQRLFSYGSNWGDLDQDGYSDIFITTMGKNYIFWNKYGKYFQIDSTSIEQEDLSYSTSSLLTDMDNDGDLDIVVANYQRGRSCIYVNKSDKSNWIKIQVRGSKSNKYGLGANVQIFSNGYLSESDSLLGFKQITIDVGYVASGFPEVYFCLPNDTIFDLKVNFTSGETITRVGLTTGKTYIVEESIDLANYLSGFSKPLGSIFLKTRYRSTVIYFFAIIILSFVFNYFIYKRKYWTLMNYLFFNSALIIVSFITYQIYSNKTNVFLLLIPFYIFIGSGIGLYYITNKYFTLKFKDEKVFELYDLLRQLNHSHSGITHIDHLLFFCNNYKPLLNVPNFVKDWQNEISFLQTNTYKMLSRIGILAQRWYWKTNKEYLIMERIIKFGKILVKFSVPPNQNKVEQIKDLIVRIKEGIDKLKLETYNSFSIDLIFVLNTALSNFWKSDQFSVTNLSGKNPLNVVMRSDSLTQVMYNILENALQAMKDNPDKKIDITISNIADNHVNIDFTDFGHGIKEEIREKIFEENFSTNNSSGIGLFHARKILQQFNADINLVNSEIGKGSTFQIHLRIQPDGKTNNFND